MRHKIGTAAAAALLAMAMAAPACAQGPEITVQRPAAKGDTLQVTLSIQEPRQSAHRRDGFGRVARFRQCLHRRRGAAAAVYRPV